MTSSHISILVCGGYAWSFIKIDVSIIEENLLLLSNFVVVFHSIYLFGIFFELFNRISGFREEEIPLLWENCYPATWQDERPFLLNFTLSVLLFLSSPSSHSFFLSFSTSLYPSTLLPLHSPFVPFFPPHPLHAFLQKKNKFHK